VTFWPLALTMVLTSNCPCTLVMSIVLPLSVRLWMETCAGGATVTATACDSVAAPNDALAAEVAVTVMTAEPWAAPVTTPVAETVATLVLLDV